LNPEFLVDCVLGEFTRILRLVSQQASSRSICPAADYAAIHARIARNLRARRLLSLEVSSQ